MTQITDIIISLAMGILTILAGIAVQAVKVYLIKKGGEKAVLITEILAKNAVHAVEQVATETGYKGADKLASAKAQILAELQKYNIHMSDDDLTLFVESAVKQMHDAWKE
ncbi:TPA: phage holin [Streptococcus agalactiae]|uniref:phage holin n=1 Tax=Streptococcus agalactiae TaxID=1311 RepID=UPI0002B992CC|nr:phage holin [Streptococcus agalactiae]AYJ74999.1 holin [Streptococcus phage LF3]HEP3200123.1 phage holin [Streptococcus pyogenes]EPT97953.1 N-acetylmuramoyl-L-alanine amidase [Streptococcus agalactiae BSU92]EPV73425.1 N-acetylmuramoyl-L-alanine amidase [Streptococcus agalactiae GB00947]KAA9082215.1 phage holin [Streptococcus agalactiae]